MAMGFFILSLIVKGAQAVQDAKAAAHETRANLILYVLDTLTVAPYLTLAAMSLSTLLHAPGAIYAGEVIWDRLGAVPTAIAAVMICDFLGYWNHRLFHITLLWPSHAIHHSDTRLNWFSLVRQHPFDRLGALFDLVGMIALGLPEWAVVTAVLVRHYWGHLIHADLPWTLGPLEKIFISPSMHRWHHALEQQGSGVNFATIFSLYDAMFGTYYAPAVFRGPTGVSDVIEPGPTGQYLHPLRTWFPALRKPAPAAHIA